MSLIAVTQKSVKQSLNGSLHHHVKSADGLNYQYMTRSVTKNAFLLLCMHKGRGCEAKGTIQTNSIKTTLKKPNDPKGGWRLCPSNTKAELENISN